jgi:PKD repeat protein
VIEPQIPVISTKGTFKAEGGAPFSLQIAATHSPTLYEANGLPAGLVLNRDTGLISGSPTTDGSYTLSLRASNANGTGTRQIAILVNARQPHIAAVPATAAIGSVIDLTGEGFAGTTGVYFTDYRGHSVSAEFQVLSDGRLRVTVPSLMIHPSFGGATRIHVITPAGATVTVPPDFVSVSGEATPEFLKFYIVQSGGALGGNGSSLVGAYISAGGSATGSGGAYFVEAGGSLTLPGIAGQVISAYGADIIGTPWHHVQVPVLTPSYVSNLVNILPIPAIMSSRNVFGSLGLPFIYSAVATNNPGAFTAEGLPAGLSINPTNGIISGRVTGGEGIHEVLLSATNGEGTGTALIVLTIRDDYRVWKENTFASLEGGAANPKAADSADPDGDGVANVIEFATGLDPLRSEPGVWSLQPIMVGDSPRFRYRRTKGQGTGSTERATPWARSLTRCSPPPISLSGTQALSISARWVCPPITVTEQKPSQ